MFAGSTVAAVLLMGGEGRRFGQTMPKQFVPLLGRPIYQYALQTLRETGFFDQILLVCHPDWIGNLQEEGVQVVAGGTTRQESSFRGICALRPVPDIVLLHDAVRPFVTHEIIEKNLKGAIAHGAANTCIASTDTLVFAPGKKRVQSIPRREDFLRGQTPQTFRTEQLMASHRIANERGVCGATDDCALVVAAGFPVEIVEGSVENIKITVDWDLHLAELWLRQKGEKLCKSNCC
ncbi:MAG: 2-C-methyl-D-erythritol 4-phosphate cytidylyltransferase [Verrucomicrobiota bacterium]|nr:2-C-methyl-D-erythritol 4-phosphate cytidylyltransferase [Verrucomicrobiota bacterium]